MKVPIIVEHSTLLSESGLPVKGITVTCTRCAHSVNVFGTGEASIKRGCVMLHESCPRNETNFYAHSGVQTQPVSSLPIPKIKQTISVSIPPVQSSPISVPTQSIVEDKPMYLLFDTETTGLPAGSDTIHMVQLAWELYDDNQEKRAAADFIIRPEGFVIPNEVAKIHGITQARAMTEGRPLENVLSLFASIVYLPVRLVGHNINFDVKILLKEYERLGWTAETTLFGSKERLCTMESSINLCAIPRKIGGFKTPKLAELYHHLFNKDFADAHNARADIAATAECFWELRRKGIL
jgi:DNA polymerase III epsilon subunit-like protein